METIRIDFESLINVSMIFFNKKGITGGIPRVIRHYPVANNKKLCGYDKSEKCKYILNLELAKCMDLPYHNCFLMTELNLLNICQCSHLTLSRIVTKKTILVKH